MMYFFFVELGPGLPTSKQHTCLSDQRTQTWLQKFKRANESA